MYIPWPVNYPSSISKEKSYLNFVSEFVPVWIWGLGIQMETSTKKTTLFSLGDKNVFPFLSKLNQNAHIKCMLMCTNNHKWLQRIIYLSISALFKFVTLARLLPHLKVFTASVENHAQPAVVQHNTKKFKWGL